MKVIEVQFDGHVRMPDSQRATNVLRVDSDNKLGASIIVDDLVEDTGGVLATKTVEKDGKLITYRKRYPWASVTEVVYEPEVAELKPSKSDSSQSQVKKP